MGQVEATCSHSFGDFNVPNNNIANFVNDSGLATSNILGRVTGGNISNIFGNPDAGFGNASLFLMNPAGFLFGPNATVNVGGMVSFTSADYLRLADGVRLMQSRIQARPRFLRGTCGGLWILGFESWSHHGSRQPVVRHAWAEHLTSRREHHSSVWHARRRQSNQPSLLHQVDKSTWPAWRRLAKSSSPTCNQLNVNGQSSRRWGIFISRKGVCWMYRQKQPEQCVFAGGSW